MPGFVGAPWTLERAQAFEMPYGKYKGRLMTAIPRDYLGWLVANLEDGKGPKIAAALILEQPPKPKNPIQPLPGQQEFPL